MSTEAPTPGEQLLHDFLKPNGIRQAELARCTGIPPSRLTEIIKGRRIITAETAIALAAFFDMDAAYWMQLQSNYDLQCAEMTKGDAIRRRVETIRDNKPHKPSNDLWAQGSSDTLNLLNMD